MTEKIPLSKVDRAVRRIERWGTPEELKAMHDAVGIQSSQEQRQAIVAVGERLMQRRGQRAAHRKRGEKIPGWW